MGCRFFRTRRQGTDSAEIGGVVACVTHPVAQARRGEAPFDSLAAVQALEAHLGASRRRYGSRNPLWLRLGGGAPEFLEEAPDEAGLFELDGPLFFDEEDALRHGLFSGGDDLGPPPACRSRGEFRVWMDEACRRAGSVEGLLAALGEGDLEGRLTQDWLKEDLDAIAKQRRRLAAGPGRGAADHRALRDADAGHGPAGGADGAAAARDAGHPGAPHAGGPATVGDAGAVDSGGGQGGARLPWRTPGREPLGPAPGAPAAEAPAPEGLAARVAANVAALERLLDPAPLSEGDRAVLAGYSGWTGLAAAFDVHEGMADDPSDGGAVKASMARLRELARNDDWVLFEHLAEFDPDRAAGWAAAGAAVAGRMPDGTARLNVPGGAGPQVTLDPAQAEIGRLLSPAAERPRLLGAPGEALPGFVGAFVADAPSLPVEGELRHVPTGHACLRQAVAALPPGAECVALVGDDFWSRTGLALRARLARVSDWAGGDRRHRLADPEAPNRALHAVRLRRRAEPNARPFSAPLAAADGVADRLAVEHRSLETFARDAAAAHDAEPGPPAPEPGPAPDPNRPPAASERAVRDSLAALGRQARALLDMEGTDAPAADIAEARDRLRGAVEEHLGAHRSAQGIDSPRNGRLLAGHPDGHLILSLQGVQMGREWRSPLLERRLLFPPAPLPGPMAPEEAADRSLAERGGLDLGWCARATGLSVRGFCAAALEAGACFVGPDGGLAHREAFLSGDVEGRREAVRNALAALEGGPEAATRKGRARAGRLRASLAALDRARPERIPFESISVAFGAAWVPDAIHERFIDHLLLGAPASPAAKLTWRGRPRQCDIAVGRPRDRAEFATLNRVDYGIGRMTAVRIMKACLEGRDVTVNKRVPNPRFGEEGQSEWRYVLDPVATVSARERRDRILGEFRDWVPRDPGRRQVLEEVYNRRYGGYRHREHDGALLRCPGASGDVELRWNQRRAAARILHDRRTLLDHVVGAGKTFASLAGIRSAQHARIADKALVCVPNHLLSQWAREIHALYPEARVLRVAPADLAPGHLNRTVARMEGRWDLAVFPHSGLLRLRRAGCDPAALGFDVLCVDEAHVFKAISLPGFTRRLPGLSAQGAQAADFLLRCTDSLHATHPQGKTVFASGTPIANSLAEMWVLQRYMDPEGMERRGDLDFPAWLQTYGEVSEDIEVDDAGTGLVSRQRLRRFRNTPEIAGIYRRFADVCLGSDMADAQAAQWDIPPVAGGRPEMAVVKPSRALRAAMASLTERMRRIKEGDGPEEGDSVLAVLNDGRHLALSVRLRRRDADIGDGEPTKLRAAADRIAGLWRRWEAQRGLQLVFCDLAVPKSKVPDAEFLAAGSPFDDPERPYDVYNDLKLELCRRGVPPAEVAFVHDAGTLGRRQALFDACREGRVRVLVGSTAKMGTGVNVQERLTAVHHLDAPWRPADMEQRDGRILRTGNRLVEQVAGFEVEIVRYASERTTDAKVWQTLEVKQKMLDDLRRGRLLERSMEDLSSEAAMGYEELKALAAGSKATYDLMLERKTLAVIARNEAEHERRVAQHAERVRAFDKELDGVRRRLEGLAADEAARPAPGEGGFEGFRDRLRALAAEIEAGAPPEREAGTTSAWSLGTLGGLPCRVALRPEGAAAELAADPPRRFSVIVQGAEVLLESEVRFRDAYRLGRMAGMVHRQLTEQLEPERFAARRRSLEGSVKDAKRARRRSSREALRPFPQAAEREESLARIRRLETAVAEEASQGEPAEPPAPGGRPAPGMAAG